jgi:hypothetical protein
MDDITLTEIEKFLKMTRVRGGQIITILGRLHPNFETYMNTEVGRELLKRDVERCDELLEKIYLETSTDLERAEFRLLKKRIEEIFTKVQNYMKNVNVIKQVVK